MQSKLITSNMQEKKYLDSTLSIPERVDDLLSRMDIKEKVAQLGSEYSIKLIESRKVSRRLLEKYTKNDIGQITIFKIVILL